MTRSNYSVDAVYDGREAFDYLETKNYDAVILDVMIPELDGISVLRTMRAKGNRVPVMILTAKSEVDDKVEGLDSGANDYLTKPFSPRELLARLRAMTRTQVAADSVLRIGNISLDTASFELASPTGSFRLAAKEFQMLEMLMSVPGRVIPAQQFLDWIWGYDNAAENQVVWVYISYLRKKLSALNANVCIRATRGVGYSLEKEHD